MILISLQICVLLCMEEALFFCLSESWNKREWSWNKASNGLAWEWPVSVVAVMIIARKKNDQELDGITNTVM